MYRQRPNWWASWHIFVAFVKHLKVRHTYTFYKYLVLQKFWIRYIIHRILEKSFIKYLGTANSLHASRLTVSVHWRNFGDVSSFSLIALKLKHIVSKYLVCSKSREFSNMKKKKLIDCIWKILTFWISCFDESGSLCSFEPSSNLLNSMNLKMSWWVYYLTQAQHYVWKCSL